MNIFEQLQHYLFHKLPFLNEQEDVDVSSIDYVMNEPKREKIHSQDLNLFKNEGYHNILAVLKKATKAEIDYWGNWYEHAHNHVKQLAQKWDIPVEVCAAVCAVLSPNLGWKMNLMAADRTISNWKNMNGDETAQVFDKIPAYKTNVAKAYKILDTGDLSIVNGPKVTVFFQSLTNPKELQRDLVLDGHAINVWRGQKAALKNLKGLTKRERVAVIQDYKKVADIVGLTPQQVQAITWFIWKYVTDAPPPPKGKVRVKKPAASHKATETDTGIKYEGKNMKITKKQLVKLVESIVKEQSYLPKYPKSPDASERITIDFKAGGNESRHDLHPPYSLKYFESLRPVMSLIHKSGIRVEVVYVDPVTKQKSTKVNGGVLERAKLKGTRKDFKKVISYLEKNEDKSDQLWDASHALSMTFNRSGLDI